MIEAVAWIAHVVIQISTGFHLKAGQHGHNFSIRFNCSRTDDVAGTVLREKLKEGRIAEVFLEVSVLLQIHRIDFRNRQIVLPKVSGELQKSDVLLADAVQNPDSTELVVRNPDDLAAGDAELALNRLHPFGLRVEILLKEVFKNVHRLPAFLGKQKDNIEDRQKSEGTDCRGGL